MLLQERKSKMQLKCSCGRANQVKLKLTERDSKKQTKAGKLVEALKCKLKLTRRTKMRKLKKKD